MNLKEVAKNSQWKDVKKALVFNSGKKIPKAELERYEEIFEEIKKYRNRKAKRKNEYVVVSLIRDDLCEELEEWYDISTNKYSMSFRLWKELANLEVSKQTLKHFSYPFITALFLWEITFHGFEEKDIKKEADELNEIMEEIKEGKAELVEWNPNE